MLTFKATSIGINYSCIALVLWQGSQLIAKNVANFQDVFVIELVVTSCLYSFIGVVDQFEIFNQASTAQLKVTKLIKRQSKINPASEYGTKLLQVAGNISLNGVRFCYPSHPRTIVLESVDLKFPAGKMTAIVGPSGSGKSSLIDLIGRLYDPINGEVLLDGQNLKEFNVRWLRQQIGVVNQHPVLFNATILENITYGLIGTPYEHVRPDISFGMAHEAAKVAGAHEFITKFPKGYDQPVGNQGSLLSTSQKQQIVIARAIVSNPRILLLDEATSAINVESERNIVAALDRSKGVRTMVMVARRLSSIKTADNIVVVAHGRVVEQGTHGQLMAHNNVYAGLVLEEESVIGRVVEDFIPPQLNSQGTSTTYLLHKIAEYVLTRSRA